MPPTLPRLHDNGTPAKMLADGYEAAWNALDAARALMPFPNARDYDSDENFDRAVEESRDRLRRIDAVMDELETLIGHCS